MQRFLKPRLRADHYPCALDSTNARQIQPFRIELGVANRGSWNRNSPVIVLLRESLLGTGITLMIRPRVYIPVFVVIVAVLIAISRSPRRAVLRTQEADIVATNQAPSVEPRMSSSSNSIRPVSPPDLAQQSGEAPVASQGETSAATTEGAFASPNELTFEEMTSTRSDDLTSEPSAVEGGQNVLLRGRFHSFIRISTQTNTNGANPVLESQNIE